MTFKINERQNKRKEGRNLRDLHKGISDLKKRYQPRINVEWDEKGDLFANSHNIWNMWRDALLPTIECTF